MVIMILETVPTSVRGDLTRWMLEPKPGVFVGQMSATVRDLLWEKCCQHNQVDNVVQIWSTNTEQRFDVRQFGIKNRFVMDWEGIQLITRPISKKRQAEIDARLAQTR